MVQLWAMYHYAYSKGVYLLYSGARIRKQFRRYAPMYLGLFILFFENVLVHVSSIEHETGVFNYHIYPWIGRTDV